MELKRNGFLMNITILNNILKIFTIINVLDCCFSMFTFQSHSMDLSMQ